MFLPYLSSISIARKEPEPNFDADSATTQVARRFARIAEQVASKGLIQAPKDPVRKKNMEEKVREMIETEVRFKHIQEFMKIWNEYREMYLKLDPIQPKNKGQITVIENSIEFAKEKGMKLNILVACIHKAYEKRHVRPNYNCIMLYGEEAYDRYYDSVIKDFEREDYEYAAMYKKKDL